jgi:RNA polymerase sigma factor (sigma-70 family)
MTPAAEVVTMRLSEARVVTEAVDQLPKKDRELLTLVAWEGLTRAEAAKVVGCSLEAAKKRHQRAVRRLRARLTESQSVSDSRGAQEGGD